MLGRAILVFLIVAVCLGPGLAAAKGDPEPAAPPAQNGAGQGQGAVDQTPPGQAPGREPPGQSKKAEGSPSEDDTGQRAQPNDRAQGHERPGASHGPSGDADAPGQSRRDGSSNVPPTHAVEAPRDKQQEGKLRAPPVVKETHDLTHTLRVARNGRHHELAWTATDHATRGYQVWRSNSPFALIATLPADQTAFVDENAPSSSKYKVTYYTEETVEQGFVPASAEPALLPEWNPDVFATASLAAPVVVKIQPSQWPAWLAGLEAALVVGGLIIAIAKPEASARALREARSGVVRGAAVLTLASILLGETLERRLGLRLMSRMTDAEILAITRFLRSAEATPAERTPTPEASPVPRITVDRLVRPADA